MKRVHSAEIDGSSSTEMLCLRRAVATGKFERPLTNPAVLAIEELVVDSSSESNLAIEELVDVAGRLDQDRFRKGSVQNTVDIKRAITLIERKDIQQEIAFRANAQEATLDCPIYKRTSTSTFFLRGRGHNKR